MTSPRGRRKRDDVTARMAAVLALPRERSASPALLAAARDPSLQVARAALTKIREIGGPDEARVLRERLLDADLALVPAYVATLRSLGDEETVRIACEGLRNPALSRRLAAAFALKELADGTTSPVLLVARDPIAAVRRFALDALAALGPSVASERACTGMLSDPNGLVRAAAVRALLRISREPQRQLRPKVADAAKNVRLELARACALFDDEMVRALLSDVEPDVRARVAWALLEAPRETLVAPLVSALVDPDWHVRRAAARALGATREDRVADALVNALVDPHALVRAAALRSLHETFGTGLIDVLSARLGTESDSSRTAIVHALATCDAGPASRGIAALHDDPSPDVRIAVAHTLANLKVAAARRILERLVGDQDEAVRYAAAVALDRIRDGDPA